MYVKHLRCVSCGKRYPRDKMWYRCDCGSSLDIVYDYSLLKQHMSWAKLRKRPFNHWRYREFYPYVHPEHLVTIAEGGTPLAESRTVPNTFFKLENCNPTGSFKDRGTTVEISHALDMKAKKVVCASTGNMGASVSAYCARAGLKCEIVLPRDTTQSKIRQISVYGSRITKVDGDYTKAAQVASQKHERRHDFLVGDYSFRGEGEKSVGFEIADQLGKLDYLICPVGNGTLISGIWKGFREFRKAGLLKQIPKLIGVQAKGCMPVAKAFASGKKLQSVLPKTKATAIACGDPLDGDKAVQALQESKGQVVIVSDRELFKARKIMSEKEGIDAELAGVAAYCAVRKLRLPKDSTKVCLVTGHSLKDIELLK